MLVRKEAASPKSYIQREKVRSEAWVGRSEGVVLCVEVPGRREDGKESKVAGALLTRPPCQQEIMTPLTVQ